MTPIRVAASITSSDQATIARAIETFARAAAGMALEGAEVYVVIAPDTEDDTEAD